MFSMWLRVSYASSVTFALLRAGEDWAGGVGECALVSRGRGWGPLLRQGATSAPRRRLRAQGEGGGGTGRGTWWIGEGGENQRRVGSQNSSEEHISLNISLNT